MGDPHSFEGAKDAGKAEDDTSRQCYCHVSFISFFRCLLLLLPTKLSFPLFPLSLRERKLKGGRGRRHMHKCLGALIVNFLLKL